MGSTSEHRDRGITDRQFWQDRLDKQYRILDCATIGRTVFYAAVETTEGPNAGKVEAFIALQHWAPNDWYNFTHKTMTETAGPCDASCPARILDLLTPITEDQHTAHPVRKYGYCPACAALEWRASCREVADNRARAAKVRKGQVVKFSKPIEFRSGAEVDTFRFLERDVFQGYEDGYRYRITDWRGGSGWELVPA
jgi:hypothetical protein